MDKITQFLAKYNITTHVLAGGWLFLVQAYYDNQVFHNYVTSTAHTLYTALPKPIEALIVGGIVPLVTMYRTGLTAKGKAQIATEHMLAQPKAIEAKAVAPEVKKPEPAKKPEPKK